MDESARDNHARLVALLKQRSLELGSFTLSSGRQSSYYIDARRTTMSAAGLGLVGSLQYNNGNPELRIDMGLDIAPSFERDLDLGQTLQDLGLDVTGSATIQVGQKT